MPVSTQRGDAVLGKDIWADAVFGGEERGRGEEKELEKVMWG